MQLLIDSTQETPASLRFAASVLAQLADLLVPVELTAETPSINGTSSPIVLHAHGPAAPIDPQPVITTEPAQMNPAEVFGRAALTLVPGSVPVGTYSVTPPLASVVPSPPVETVSLQNATVPAAPAAPSVVAPVAGNLSVTPPTPGADTASSDRDSEGLPWDARIHSETKKQNADGTWRLRRNLDATVKATVYAELKAQYGSQQQAPLAPTAPAAPLADASGAGTTVAPPPVAPPPPNAPVAPQPPLPTVGAGAAVPVPNGVSVGVPNAPQPPNVPSLGFRDFMSAVNKALAAGTLTQDQLTAACKAAQVDGITALASEPGKIAPVHSQIVHLLGATAA